MASVAMRLAGNGEVRRAPKRRAKGRSKAMVAAQPRLAVAITVGAGVGIPALTLSLSTMAGRLAAHGHVGLGVGIGVVGATVLAVSLSHLAWAVQDITRSPRWASWLLAIAVDCGLVACELVQIGAPGVCDGLAFGVMVAVTIASMVLNVWAFLRHR